MAASVRTLLSSTSCNAPVSTWTLQRHMWPPSRRPAWAQRPRPQPTRGHPRSSLPQDRSTSREGARRARGRARPSCPPRGRAPCTVTGARSAVESAVRNALVGSAGCRMSPMSATTLDDAGAHPRRRDGDPPAPVHGRSAEAAGADRRSPGPRDHRPPAAPRRIPPDHGRDRATWPSSSRRSSATARPTTSRSTTSVSTSRSARSARLR